MQPDELAQMRAEMLMRQEQSAYDDGASQLGMNPYMQQVGLFGKGKPKPVAPPIDIQRRSILGLKPQAPLPDNLPAVRSSDVPVPNAAPMTQAPAQPAPTTTPLAPLGQMANKALNTPISRREVLKKTGQVALNQMLPSTGIASEIASPLAQVAKAAPAYDKNAIIGAISSFITDKMTDTSSDLAEELMNKGVWEPDDPNDSDAADAWEYAQYGDYMHENYRGDEEPDLEQTTGLQTLRDNFNLQKLSEHSGIPVEELRKHITDMELQGFPLMLGNSQENLTAIRQDGRPKEAVRMTALEDLDKPEKYLKKAAKELFGKRKDFDDAELEEIADHAHSLAYDDYVNRTLNAMQLPDNSIHNKVMNQAGSNWLFRPLQNVFEQGAEWTGHDMGSFLDNAYDVFKLKGE